MLGPRDGEVISIVEPLPAIEIMIQPDAPDGDREYDIAIYTLERNARPGVFYYTYARTVHHKEGERPDDNEDR